MNVRIQSDLAIWWGHMAFIFWKYQFYGCSMFLHSGDSGVSPWDWWLKPPGNSPHLHPKCSGELGAKTWGGSRYVALGAVLRREVSALVPNILPENRRFAFWNIATSIRTALSCHHLYATVFLHRRSLKYQQTY